MPVSVMLVDDEKEILALVALYLREEGLEVSCFENGADALAFAGSEPVDLAILDVMLPDMDGFSICSRLREKHNFPVIMLTARDGDMDKINGLTLGADDYITKPFNPLELVARVKAQLRRFTRYNSASEAVHKVYDSRGLIVDYDRHECSLYGKEISLTPIEFGILRLLCENSGRVVSSEELFEKVWGEKYYDSNNTVMVHIRRLREKLGEPARKPKFIKTVWGVGYKVE